MGCPVTSTVRYLMKEETNTHTVVWCVCVQFTSTGLHKEKDDEEAESVKGK